MSGSANCFNPIMVQNRSGAGFRTQHLVQSIFSASLESGYFGVWTFVTSMHMRHFPADSSGSSNTDKTQLRTPNCLPNLFKLS